jgi:hypothetical protein
LRKDDMKTVISISLGSTSQDFEFTTRFLGQKLQVRRLGTGGNVARAIKLVKHWDGQADAIGLGLVKDSHRLGGRSLSEREVSRLKAAATQTPTTTGSRLRELFLEWAVRHTQSELGRYFDNAKVLFFSGLQD